MRLLILCAVALLTAMQACAQRISLSLKNATFRELLRAIEQQTHFSFVYSSEQLEHLPALTIQTDSADVFALLREKLRPTSIGFTVKGDFIILTSGNKRRFQLRGKITDRNGAAVEGATIQTADGINMAITDNTGAFVIGNILPGDKLTVSGAEIETLTVRTEERAYMEISVHEAIRELEGTVVPGYGSIKKRFNTGNITKIDAAGLHSPVTGNLLTSLQGRVPGLLITASGGAPSSSYLMQIRGQHSLNPNPLINYRIPPVDQPLIIIDGIPFAPQNNNINQLTSIASPGNLEFYQNPYGGISPFSLINPEMIESIEILKDAVATSVYGSRAANGIVLINTKKPGNKNISIGAAFSTGLNFISKRPAMLTVQDYLTIRRQAFELDSLQPNLIPGSPGYAPDLLLYENNRQTDFHRYFFSVAAPVLCINTSAQGQIGNAAFLSGINIRQEKYLLKGDFYSQQFSSNNQLKLTGFKHKLDMAATFIYSRGRNRSLASPSILGSVRLPPNYPALYDERGYINWDQDGIELADNPAALLRQIYTLDASGLLISSKISYKLSKGLTALINTGYSGLTTKEMAIFPTSSFIQRNQRNARTVFAQSGFSTKLLEPQFSYNFTTRLFSYAMVTGLTLQQNGTQMNTKKGTQYTNESLMNSIDMAGKIDERSIDDTYGYTSLFSNMNVQYAGKYLLQLSGRRERSTRFARNSKPGLFASFGTGWIFSEEAFVKKNMPWLRFGKLRLSYGSAGNDNVGYYHYLHAWAQSTTYTGNSGTANLRDASLSWSVTHKLEAGLELRLFDDRISLDISAFRHLTGDQLISQLSSTQPGRTRYFSNFPAVVENKGLEIMAGISSSQKAKISWSSQLNLSMQKNRLKEFPSIENSLYAGMYWVDKALGTSGSIHYAGIDASTGFYAFDQDKKIYVDIAPNAYGGWLNKLSIGRWGFEMFFEFRIQKGMNYMSQTSDQHPGMALNLPKAYFTENGISGVPLQRPALASNTDAVLSSHYLSISDAAYNNASYLKLRHLIANFHAGKNRNTRIYVQMQNILTLTSFKLADPETQSFYSYPLSRAVTAGISVQF